MICEKDSYLNRKDWKKAARTESNRLNKKLRAYKCQECNYFHITSQVDLENKKFYRDKLLKIRQQLWN